MSAAPLEWATPPRRRSRATLYVAPPARRRPTRRHDGAYAACLALLLVTGVVGVLLLNTSMQQQADRIAAQQRALASLRLEQQTLHVAIERAADPRMLAAPARALHLRPIHRLRFLAVPPTAARLSAPTPAGRSAPSG